MRDTSETLMFGLKGHYRKKDLMDFLETFLFATKEAGKFNYLLRSISTVPNFGMDDCASVTHRDELIRMGYVARVPVENKKDHLVLTKNGQTLYDILNGEHELLQSFKRA